MLKLLTSIVFGGAICFVIIKNQDYKHHSVQQPVQVVQKDYFDITNFPESAKREVYCLAQNIYFESRGESLEGQVAVALVTMRRTRDANYPTNVCAVVYQPNQFEWTKHPAKSIDDPESWNVAFDIAKLAYQGLIQKDPTNGATHFFAHKKLRPYWYKAGKHKTVIGNHTFLAMR